MTADTEFAKKITGIPTYNLICHFVPGLVFIYLVDNLTGFDFLSTINTDNSILQLMFAVALSFAVGVLVNRIGSSLLRIIQPLPYVENWYERYVAAKPKDEEIGKLIEMKELYKSLVASLVILATILAGQWIYSYISESKWAILPTAILLTLLLLLVSYRKQDVYINRRIDYYQEKTPEVAADKSNSSNS